MNRARIGLALIVLVGTVDVARAQSIPRSQLATVTQSLAGAQIEMVYRRPTARGRELFGKLVPWDRIWSASADSAPRFTTSLPIEVNGEALPAGSYSVWTIPGEAEWTWVFNSQAAVFHLRHSSDADVLKVKAKPESAEHVETLTFDFPLADGDSAVMRLHWGRTSVPLRIKVKRAP